MSKIYNSLYRFGICILLSEILHFYNKGYFLFPYTNILKIFLNEIYKLDFQAENKTKLQALYNKMSKVDLDGYKDGTFKKTL